MKSLIMLIMLLMLTSCAAFQRQPELQSVTALELFEWMDEKATSAEQSAIENKQTADRLLQVFAATKSELQRRVNDGDITDIQVFNQLGFGLLAKPDDSELPSSKPDSTKNSNNL